jgi:hypothetical protein
MVAGSARMLNAEHQLDRNGHPIVASPSANAVGGPHPNLHNKWWCSTNLELERYKC